MRLGVWCVRLQPGCAGLQAGHTWLQADELEDVAGGGTTGTSGDEGARRSSEPLSSGDGAPEAEGEGGGENKATRERRHRPSSLLPLDTMSGIEITEPDMMFDPKPLLDPTLAKRLDPMGCFPTCGGGGGKRARSGKPDAALVAELDDPACEPLTLVYCLFRYRHNTAMVSTLLEKLECHAQPAKLSAFTLHLCWLMLLEPLAAPVEFFLLQKCKSSLHHALQVYWFCQGMIEDHDASPGPSNYQRFLRMQREVQTSVGHRAEAMASNLLSMQQRSDSFTRRTHMRTLERTNKAHLPPHLTTQTHPPTHPPSRLTTHPLCLPCA